jgi:hypothetical protein
MTEFFDKLAGPEGCDFKDDPDRGMTWQCAGGTDKSISMRILGEMGISYAQAQVFLAECDRNGGHCDCEIIFNAMERMEGGE